jgi:hypothetical protein
VHVPLWEKFLREHGGALAGVTPGTLAALDWEGMGRALIQRMGASEGESEPRPALRAADYAVGAAVGLALVKRGFAIEAPPGAQVTLVRASRRIEPFDLRQRVAKDPEGWRAMCAEIGFANLALAERTGGDAAAPRSA